MAPDSQTRKRMLFAAISFGIAVLYFAGLVMKNSPGGRLLIGALFGLIGLGWGLGLLRAGR